MYFIDSRRDSEKEKRLQATLEADVSDNRRQQLQSQPPVKTDGSVDYDGMSIVRNLYFRFSA